MVHQNNWKSDKLHIALWFYGFGISQITQWSEHLVIYWKKSLKFDWDTHSPKAITEYKGQGVFLNLKLDPSSIYQKRIWEK